MPYCQNCGSTVDETAYFCTKCGCDLKSEEAPKEQSTGNTVLNKCSFHPSRDAVGACDTCGKAVCDLCRTVVNGKTYCIICFNSIIRQPSIPVSPVTISGNTSETSQNEDVKEINIAAISESLVARKKRNRKLILVVGIVLATVGVLAWVFVPACHISAVMNPTDGGHVTCNGTFRRFTHTQITATPNECYRFVGWTGDGISDMNLSSTIVSVGMSGRTVTANFQLYCISPCVGHQYWEYFDTQPPYYANAFSDGPISLENNENAVNPTWSQLKAFILNDDTDQKTYIAPLFMCGDYAEQVHNNAEEAGFKAAFVAVFFADDSIGHALNAFHTTDKGLVFIDCTGGQNLIWGYPTAGDWDKIAYVEIGKDYGLVSLDVASGVTYAAYEQYLGEYQNYINAVDAYNNLYWTYTWPFGERYQCEYEGDAEACNHLNSIYNQLVGQADELDRWSEELGEIWESLGVVENISIYW